MTTAITDVVKEDGVTPADPFDLGAGRIDVGASVYAPITFDESPANFAAMGDDPVQAVHLNLPSINAPVMPGRLVTTRVATNASGAREKLDVSATASPGSTITVSPKKLTVPPGGSATLTITIESSAEIGQQQFGEVRLDPESGAPLHLPVAFIHTQGTVSLVQACSPQTIVRTGQTTCSVEAANESFDDQVVDLDTSTSKLKVLSADGASVVDQHHVQIHDVALSGAEPGVPAVDPGASPGYLPLDGFGVPVTPVGDETVVNFNLTGALLEFAGQSWDRIGVDSNGYVVLGGATVDDNNCCNLPGGPDPARPNNVLAPFWTDLNGATAPGILVGFLGNATDEWLVVEFRLDVFGTNDERRFQVWIGDNSEFDDDDSEDITFAYSAAQTDPSGQDFLVGAENQLGDGDMEAVLPSADLRVASSAFTPGGSVAYDLTARGNVAGVQPVRTEMVADGVPGVTVVTTDVRVLPPIVRPAKAVP
jgi:hypothetical protein